jgi:hypothetical protein
MTCRVLTAVLLVASVVAWFACFYIGVRRARWISSRELAELGPLRAIRESAAALRGWPMWVIVTSIATWIGLYVALEYCSR